MSTDENNLKAAAADIMDRFDFDRVRRVMEALNWTWWDSPEVPSLNRLRGTADELLEGVIHHWLRTGEDRSHATGGFEARIRNIRDQSPELVLLFIVGSCRGQ